MSSDTSPSAILRYLSCELPFDYPFEPPISTTLLAGMREKHRKEMTLQQVAFFEMANGMAATHPWIAFLGALKHEALLSLIPLDVPQFVLVTDQKIFNDCLNNWRMLRRAVQPAMEESLAFFCERLVALQRDAAKLDDLEEKLQAALAAGFTSLTDLPVEPPNGTPSRLMSLSRAAREEAEASVKRWHHQDSYMQAAQKVLNKILCVSPEMRRSGLGDVPGTLQALRDFREERAVLVGQYITPYLA